MNHFSTQKNLLCAALCASFLVGLSGCQDEDFGHSVEEVRQEVYNRNFKEIFGEVDPDHTWSMAQNVKVNINVPGARGYQVRILTEAPTNRESIILYDGFMTSDMLTVSVDVISGKQDVYIEVKSKELGIFLVDGYYQIDECGVVNATKASTRAAGGIPDTKAYQATIKRWNRHWNDATAAPDDNWYSYDWAFENNKELRFEYIAPGDKWSFYGHSSSTSNNGENYSTPVTLDDGAGNRVPKTVDHHVFTVNGTMLCSGINIPQDWATFYVLLTNWYSGDDKKVKVNIRIKKPGANQGDPETLVKEENGYTVQSNVNTNVTNAPLNYDVVKIVINNSETSYWTSQKLEIEIVENTHLICGGFFIESFKYDKASENESINSFVTYKDVRGGGVNLWQDKNHLKLFQGDTKRNYGANVFKYRTFDTRKMVYMVGDKYTPQGGTERTLAEGDEMLGKTNVAAGTMGPFYIIDGNIKTGEDLIKFADMFPLYGLYKSQNNGAWKGSPFREGDNHIDPYFTDEGYHTAKEFEMQKDAQIVTIGSIHNGEINYDGEVSIKMVGMGTDWSNDVGYFYYPKSEESTLMRSLPNGEKALDFNKIPKIVIKKDMQGSIDGQKVENLISGDDLGDYSRVWLQNYAQSIDVCYAMTLNGSDLSSLLSDNKFSNYQSDRFKVRTIIDAIKNDAGKKQKAADAKFKAPIFKLPFFGWQQSDGKFIPDNSKATYEWPADYVIGFFGIRTDDMVAAELSRIYTTSASVERNYFNDIPRGSMFSYKGKNYIGLEDEWDYDNNDILFEIQGIQSIDPDITPKDDVTTDKTIQNWIVACEDLGGVWDYDFNDLVWAVSKEVNTTTTIHGSTGERTEVGTTDIYFQALAAGGTLEAIVEYNTSIALAPGESGWNNDAWIQVGEIHKLVKQDDNAQMTGEGAQLNVKQGVNITQYGKRIKLGSTIPTNSSDINMVSILSHFRVKIKGKNGEYVVTNVTAKEQSDEGHGSGHHDYISTASNVPQFILLPGGWDWPAEGVCINEAYSGVTSWVTNKSNTTWYNEIWSSNTSTGARITNPLK